jgi:NAD(P)-dependent dehydrogenase (short-subunit alcohol dehydrogenase family)
MKSILASILFAAAVFVAGIAQAATVLITGANRGLGLEFARQYAADGWTVIATARNLNGADELKKLSAAHRNLTLKTLDVADQQSIATLAKDLKGTPIDVLINNAGVLGAPLDQTLGSLKYETFQEVMAVNTYGPLALSEALRENVIASTQKKIVAITSGSGIISGRAPGGRNYFYGTSKLALNMVMRGLASDLRSQGVVVGIIAPGAVDTDMRRQVVGDRASQDLRPEVSIGEMRKVIAGLTLAKSGIPLNYDGRELPW